ncbi:restriction endonuclease subunit S [Vibrio cholerae]|uniref:restriction endonuclease subunit S n=1 Tax=Vibrio cholerae TaxID=666 RepID=UPI003966D25B
MSQLPKGWVSKSLLDLCDVKTGKVDANHAKEFGAYTFYTCALEPFKSDTYSFEGDLIILPGNGANVGHVGFYQGKIEAYQRTYVIHNSLIKAKYLYFHLKLYWKKRNEEKQFGSATNYIKIGNFKDYIVEFPPLAEQTRIVEKLDEVLAQVDTIKARLDGIPAILKRFRQSVLAAAVSGKLTEEWRGECGALGQDLGLIERTKVGLINDKTVKKDLNFEISNKIFDIPDTWSFLKLKSLSSKITDGEHKTPTREESGRYLLSARNVRDGYLSLDNVDYVGEEEYQKLRKRCDPNKGDVLISCSGSVGRISLVDADDKYVMVRSAALVKVIDDFLLNSYLVYVLQSPELQKRIEESSKSTAQSNLFLGPIKELEIPLPSMEEQKEIVRLVDQYFAFADTIEAQVKKAQARVDKLTQSILAKAFRGELVPQDPNDEPADKLLERIALARKEAEVLAKAAKKAAKK